VLLEKYSRKEDSRKEDSRKEDSRKEDSSLRNIWKIYLPNLNVFLDN
jgi:hypothetical protein